MRIEADRNYCYLDGAELAVALQETRVLDALLVELQVPGKPFTLRALSAKDKLREIENQAEHFRRSKTSIWHGMEPSQVLAASIWRSRLVPRYVRNEMFWAVPKEADLLEPISAWLETSGFAVHEEVPMGRGRVDVVGHRAAAMLGLRPARVVAVELKNDLNQLKRGLDQMVTFRDYAHDVYLACTPALAAEYLDAHANSRGVQRWDSDVLDRKLGLFGFGLLLVEGEDVYVHLESKRTGVAKTKLAELEATLRAVDS
jgi:hypothetical protein